MNITEAFSPSPSHEEALRRASSLWGVQEEYWDIFGNRHITSPEVQRIVLTSMGVPATTLEELDRAIETHGWEKWSRLAPDVLVVCTSETIPVSVPEEYSSGELRASFAFEDGSRQEVVFSVSALATKYRAEARNQIFTGRQLPVPSSAPIGYHSLELCLTTAGRADIRSTSRLILCPDRAYKPGFLKTKKAAGIAVSLYGLRSSRNWGCGDFTDLRQFSDWVAEEVSASFVALNPLHSIPNRQPYNTSPYLPNSSYYRNPIYLDVEQVEDVQSSALAQKLLKGALVKERLEELRASPYVEYEKVFALKLRFLKAGFRQFLKNQQRDPDRATDFRQYVEKEGELLQHYALYCALDEVLHKRDRNLWIWPDWPEEYRDLQSPAIAQFTAQHQRLILFYKYVQWQLDRQLEAAQGHALQRGLKIGLYHDLALATDRCGSDLWAYGSFYVQGCRVGSPPDDFSPTGQDWAFPPPASIRHKEDGYQHFADSIRRNADHGGALRIDHVMRFFRLFWIPDGSDARSGVYVREFSDDLVRILALESVRNNVIVIGEDLGTVEPYIRETLAKFGILSYRLLYFEKHPDGSFRMPAEYPLSSLVSVSTHDLPTLAGFWTYRDINARLNAGVLGDQAAYQAQLRERMAEKQKLLDLFFRLNLLPSWHPRFAQQVPEFTGELHNAAVGFLAQTPSELMVLNQEDLFKDPDQQNLPGTTDQYPNWRHKMRYSLEELTTDETARACTRMFRSWLERTNRLN